MATEIHNRPHFAIFAIDDHLPEGALGLIQDRRAELLAQRVNKVTFVAHQEVDRRETTRRNLATQSLIGGHAIAEFGFAALSHLVDI